VRKFTTFVLPMMLAAGLTSCPDALIYEVIVTAPTTMKANKSISITGRAPSESGLYRQNRRVIWSIQSGADRLSDVTEYSVTYVAPNITASTVVVIRATAEADKSKFQDASITITP
jgi:hypothetical protein